MTENFQKKYSAVFKFDSERKKNSVLSKQIDHGMKKYGKIFGYIALKSIVV